MLKMSKIKVGLLGLGTVGTGVYKTIALQQDKIEKRIGREIEIVKVLVRNIDKERNVKIDKQLLTTSFEEVLEEDVDVLIEVMGGVEPTFDYIYEAFKKGCHVVTANKELLAKRGKELVKLANFFGRHFYYEASVAGGIPILGVLRQLLQTNNVEEIYGILNGTTNYILTQMENHHVPYEQVLKEAQELGYAEADPTSDVEGFDAMYKLYILSQLVYGEAPEYTKIPRQGISNISLTEVKLAGDLGYRFKLLAAAKKSGDSLDLQVRPTIVSIDHPLAQISDAFNAVFLKGNIVGDLLFSGKGAGEFPTASAVVEDLTFLLTQDNKSQPEWKHTKDEPSGNGVLPTVTESLNKEELAFLYIDTQQKDLSILYQILDKLDHYHLTLQQVQTTDKNSGDHIGIALVLQGDTTSFVQYLTTELKLTTKQYEIIQTEALQNTSAAQKKGNPQTVNL